METHRSGEIHAIPFRSGRFFYVDSNWYFACRDDTDQGPFDSKPEAEAGLIMYIRDSNTLDERIIDRPWAR